MLTRRITTHAAAAVASTASRAPVVRTFVSTVAARRDRTPALADIETQQTEAFNSRQKTFRERLVVAQKQREASAFQSSSPPSRSPSPSSSDDPNQHGLGSRSTALKGQAVEAERRTPERKAGPLANLIYGTKEGRELDAQIEASFSQVLARGKYVHSIVFHEVKPDKVDEYVDLVGSWYPRMAAMPENKVHLVGSWRTEVGDCDTFGTFFPCVPPSPLLPGQDLNMTTSLGPFF